MSSSNEFIVSTPCWVQESEEVKFQAEVQRIIRTKIKPWMDSKNERLLNPRSTPIYGEMPKDSDIKDAAKKLLTRLEKLDFTTSALICIEANLPPNSLRKIQDACMDIANRTGAKKRPERHRINIMHELDITYRIYTGKDPQSKAIPNGCSISNHAEFIDFASQCFHSANPNYERTTLCSIARNYFENEPELLKIAATVAQMTTQ